MGLQSAKKLGGTSTPTVTEGTGGTSTPAVTEGTGGTSTPTVTEGTGGTSTPTARSHTQEYLAANARRLEPVQASRTEWERALSGVGENINPDNYPKMPPSSEYISMDGNKVVTVDPTNPDNMLTVITDAIASDSSLEQQLARLARNQTTLNFLQSKNIPTAQTGEIVIDGQNAGLVTPREQPGFNLREVSSGNIQEGKQFISQNQEKILAQLRDIRQKANSQGIVLKNFNYDINPETAAVQVSGDVQVGISNRAHADNVEINEAIKLYEYVTGAWKYYQGYPRR